MHPVHHTCVLRKREDYLGVEKNTVLYPDEQSRKHCFLAMLLEGDQETLFSGHAPRR
jgi:hypothetical protein